MSSLDDVVEELFRDIAGASPGATIAAYRQGEPLICRGFGFANVEHEVRNDEHTSFYIASTSKQFVACATALVEADGLLDLDEEVCAYLPEIHRFDPPVRVRHLVHHTSGIRDKYALAMAAQLPEEVVGDDLRSLRLLSRQRTTDFVPGTRYSYSNSGYFLLAQIVERVSGRRFAEFTEERIFAPLGMRQTMFRDDASIVVPGRAYGYRRATDGDWRVAEYTLDSVGAGGVITTVGDLARWSHALMTATLAPSSLADRMLDREPFEDGTPNNYAFGLFVDEYAGTRVISHSGGVTGFGAEMIHIPDQVLTVVCLANSPEIGAPARARALLAALRPELVTDTRSQAPGRARAVELDGRTRPVAGVYLSSDECAVARVQRSGDAWSLVLSGSAFALIEDGGHLKLPGGGALVFDDTGFQLIPSGLLPSGSATAPRQFERVRVGADAPAPELGEFEAVYDCEELGVSVCVMIDRGSLLFEWPNAVVERGVPAGGDLFLVELAGFGQVRYEQPVRFVRNAAGKVGALALSCERAVGNLFQRIEPGVVDEQAPAQIETD